MMSETLEVIASPYPGLRPFRMDEDYLFFGREEQTAELVKLLREHRFLAVVGRSGSGKSSLVRAGLLPAIQGGMMQHAGSAWEIAVLRPGGHPIRNLAECLIDADLYDPEDEEALPRLLATLNHSALGLVQAYRQSEIEDDTNLLIVVDQFEELFRFEQKDRAAKDEAHAFVELLLEASQASDAKIYVVLTMRSDYLGDCAQVPGLAEAVNLGEYLIPRLERAQLRVAIEGPAKVGGGTVAYRLVQHLLNELGDEEDQLPVLQHALMRTWSFWQDDHAEGDEIDLRHYESSGGMKLAISNHADEVFDRLPDDEHREVAERLFRTLTVKGDDNRGVRRPTRLDQLSSISGENLAVVKAVIDAYRAPGITFLMPGADVELKEDSVIDLSHESLMRVWQRLRRWVETEAQSARIYKRLVDTAELHAEKKAGLYHNPDLEITLTWRDDEHPNDAWANQYGGGFTHAISFLDESEQQARRAELEVEQARQRELQQTRDLAKSRARSAALLKRFSIAVCVTCLIAVGLAFWATQQSRVASANAALAREESKRANLAEQQAKKAAEAERVAALAAEAAKARAEKVAAEASAAEASAKMVQGKTWLANAQALADTKNRFSARLKAARALGFQGYGRETIDTTLHDQFPVLLKRDQAESMNLWKTAEKLIQRGATSQLLWTSGLRPQHTGNVVDFVKHPDGSLIASIDQGGLVHLWDTKQGRELRILETGIVTSELTPATVTAIAFSPDGKYFVAASDQIEVFKVGDDGNFTSVQKNLPQVRRNITAMTFSSDGDRLVLADADRDLYVWRDWRENINPPQVLKTPDEVGKSGKILGMAFHPLDERMLAIVAQKNCLVLLLDEEPLMETAASVLTPVDQHGTGQPFHCLAFSPDGRLLAVAGERVPVTIWNVSDRAIQVDESSGKRAWNVADWQPAATLLGDEWDLLTSPGEGRSGELRFVGRSLAFSPDSSQVAVSWHDQGKGSDIVYYPKRVTVFDLAKDSDHPVRIGDIPSDDGPFSKVLFGNDGETLYLSRVGRLAAWNLRTWLPVDGEPVSHSAQIHSLVFSRDGFWFASGDHYGAIRVWDARTGDLIHTLRKHWGPIRGLQFSADGARLFSAGERDRLLCVWDVASGELVDLLEHDKPVVGLDLTPDGSTMLVGSWSDKLLDFDPKTFELKREIRVVTGNAPRVLPDGRQVAMFRNSSGSELNLYDLDDEGTASIVGQWKPLHDAPWVDAAFHPDGNLMAIVFQDGTVKVLERQPDRTWEESSETMPPLQEPDITQVDFDPRGRRVITATRDGKVKLWDYATGDLLEVLPGTRPITSLAVSPNGELLLTGDYEGVLHAWSIPPLEQEQLRPVVLGTQQAEHWVGNGSRSIALAPRRRLLFSTGTAERLNEIIAWELGEGRLTLSYRLLGLNNQPILFALSPDERFLVSSPAASIGELMLWDLETGESRQLDRIGRLSALAFSPDGKTIAGSIWAGSESSPQRISLWDVTDTGPPIVETDFLPSPVLGLDFTNDGKQLISCVKKEGHPVQFWDVDPDARSISLALELPTPPHQAMRLALSHDGTRLAVAFSGGQGRVWDLPASRNARPAMIKDGALFCVAFSPDGSLLATGGFGDHLSVLRTDSMEPLLQSGGDRRLQDLVTDLVFDADGSTLFVSRNDGTITPMSIRSSRKIIPPTAYLDLFDLEEVFGVDDLNGALAWKDRNVRLSPPVNNCSFAPISDHYLTQIRNEPDPFKQKTRLFESYLRDFKFRAADGLLYSMDADVAAPLKEKLASRLADHLVVFEAGQAPPEGEIELVGRLLQEFPESFGLRLARETLRDRWKDAGDLLRDESQSLSDSDKSKYTRVFIDALDQQASFLLDREEPIDESAPDVPSAEWLLASSLNKMSRQFEELMNVDLLIGFSAEIEQRFATEKLLDQFESDAWKTEPFLGDVLAMMRDLDPGAMAFPWLLAFDQDLPTDASDAPRLWRLRARTFERLGLYDQALAAAQLRLDALTTKESPAAIRESKSWLQWKEKLLRKIEAPAAKIDAVVEKFNEIPKRPSGLDPKLLDLTDFYAANLFASPDLGRLPETFVPQHGVEFDLRGVFQLGSGNGYKDDLPGSLEGIPVGQKSNAIHFLMGAMNGNDIGQVEVATISVHFADGTTERKPLINKDDICDWFQWFDAYRLPPEKRGWSGYTHNPFSNQPIPGLVPVALAEVVWENPYPDKMISHIDIVSQRTESSPFLVAITLE